MKNKNKTLISQYSEVLIFTFTKKVKEKLIEHSLFSHYSLHIETSLRFLLIYTYLSTHQVKLLRNAFCCIVFNGTRLSEQENIN